MDEVIFDLDWWTTELSPYESFEGGRMGLIVGPRDIVYLEECRNRLSGHVNLGPSVSTDVFIFAKGSTSRRDVTKVGGLPYRPESLPWPEGPDGSPMTFLAQYRFAESKDLVNSLPGDILLVFAQGEAIHQDVPQGFLRFEWYQLGLEELLVKEALPPPAWEFGTCYGVRHRTVDYRKQVNPHALARYLPEQAVGKSGHAYQAAAMSRIVGMKIAGLPFLYGRRRGDTQPRHRGRFLCSLASVVPCAETSYPWINQAEPLPLMAALDPDKRLCLGDGFLLNMFIGPRGGVCWAIEFL